METIHTFQICFPDFKINYIPKARNEIIDYLARFEQSFYKELYYIGFYKELFTMELFVIWTTLNLSNIVSVCCQKKNVLSSKIFLKIMLACDSVGRFVSYWFSIPLCALPSYESKVLKKKFCYLFIYIYIYYF